MKTLNLLLGALVAALALAASPALAGVLLAGAALAVAGAGVQALQVPGPVVQVVRVAAPEVRVFELDRGAGVVVFKMVDGKLTSRRYRACGGASC